MNPRILRIILLIIAIAIMQSTTIAQNWNQLGQNINGEAASDNSGRSVSLSADGSTLAIGASQNSGNGHLSGHVRVFILLSDAWVQQGADIEGEATNDHSGASVCLSADGSILAIGSPGNSGNGFNAGHVRVFKYISGIWTQQGSDIDAEAAQDRAGESISLSADGLTVAIGALGNDGSGASAGHVRIYKFMSGVWSQYGSDINGEAAQDQSVSVSLNANGSVVAIGARLNDGNGLDAGHVRVYRSELGFWIQQGSDIDGEAAADLSGASLSINADGSILAIGAGFNNDNGIRSGHVRVYNLVAGSWIQQGADINGEAEGDMCGFAVCLSADGSTLACGAMRNNGNGIASGHVRVFKFVSGSWSQHGADIDGEEAGDTSGSSVSLSADGSILAIGAMGNDETGFEAGQVRVFGDSKTPNGVIEDGFVVGFSVHPNPTSGLTYITLGQLYSGLNVAVSDITCKQVATFNFGTVEQANFEIEGARGIYFLDIRSAEGRSARLRVIKN